MKYLLSLIGFVMLLTSCSKEEEPAFTREKATRAVMVYMAGENNLTEYSGYRFLQSDLQEMIEGSKQLTDKQRIFVFVDSLNSSTLEKGTPYIIELHNGQTYARKQFDSDFYSCDPDKFKEIVSWMTSNIQADGYGLVLWGHASGWLVDKDSIATASANRRAYGLDTNEDRDGGEKWMNITQMAKALNGLPKMDFIFADCCNMMCAEVGYELRNATEYLIGSPAEIPGNGAPYDEILPYLFKNGSEMYKGIVDTYYDYYLEAYTQDPGYRYLSGYSVPLSVIDTKYIEQLAQQTKSILTYIMPQYPQSVTTEDVPYYWFADAPIFYDMKAILKLQVDSNAYTAWEQAYNQAVPYHRMSARWMTTNGGLSFITIDESYCGCVSMFLPLNYTSYFSGAYEINKTANNFAWNRTMDWSRFGW